MDTVQEVKESEITEQDSHQLDKVGRSTTRTPKDSTLWTTVLTLSVLVAGGSYAAPLSARDLYPVLAADQVKVVNLTLHDFFTYPSAVVDGFIFFATITVAFISANGNPA